jgi:hypothetical protein
VRRTSIAPLCRLVLGLGLALPAAAQAEAEQCDAARELDKYQLLRRLSLDLRGQVPSYDEYEALAGHETVPEAWVKTWLGGDEFRQVARRYHETLLWPNVSNMRWVGTNSRLTALPFGAVTVQSTGRRRTYRGVTDLVTPLGAQCGDFEQTQFDPAFPGQFRPHPAFIIYQNPGTSDETRQEGWRWVEPYWSPGTPIKVCAYDAQLTPTTTIGSGSNARTVSCGSTEADGRRECGCGPDLRWCHPQSQAMVDNPIRQSLREQLGRAVDEVTVGGKPYTDLLLSTKAWQNGRIAWWKRHLAGHYSLSLTYNVADPAEEVAELHFTDADTWVEVERGPDHAGVLTLPAYLLRFQTDRGRANRQRIAFECEHFAPPAELPEQAGCSMTTDDLVNRCGCQYCHAVLEPLAARYGKFAEAGTTLMTDPARFPAENPACNVNNPSAFCRRFYVTEAGAPRRGWLQALQFADLHANVQAAYDEGPRGRAQQLIETGAFARCTVKRVFTHLVKRDLRIKGNEAEELELMQSLAQGFTQNGYSFPWLVEQVVSLPQYRRIR